MAVRGLDSPADFLNHLQTFLLSIGRGNLVRFGGDPLVFTNLGHSACRTSLSLLVQCPDLSCLGGYRPDAQSQDKDVTKVGISTSTHKSGGDGSSSGQGVPAAPTHPLLLL